ncbi:MAG TPA: PHP domain-containing protein [Vicinamibacterales bacterium]|nr:PHP domain-containing protein [Vicinamibacterales bacterium]
MIDLHLHSSISDGRDEPAALAQLCREAGVTVMSVTDHDTTAGWADASAAAEALGIEFVPGVEITAVLDGHDVHVLGYFPTLRVPMLEEFLRDQRADRLRRVREMVAKLADTGVRVDLGPALREAERNPSHTIGRPQVADAMVAAGHVADRDEAFARYLGADAPAFVPRRGYSPADVVELITAAGGLASLAHPALLDRDEIIPSLILAGLPALEAFHSDHDPATARRYQRLAAASRLLVTGGSDFHGHGAWHEGTLGRIGLPPEDYARFRAALFG